MQVSFNTVKADGTLHPLGHRIGVHSGRMNLSVLLAPEDAGTLSIVPSQTPCVHSSRTQGTDDPVWDYQTNRAESCPMRGALALVTKPKVPVLKLPPGLLKFTWLKMLKNSARICTKLDSRTGMALLIPKSVLTIPGPWKNRRLEFPITPRFSETNELFKNEVFSRPSGPALRGSWMTTGATIFGVSRPDRPRRAISPDPWLILTGRPVVRRVIPERFQPPVRRFGRLQIGR